jgi:NTE family protein
VLDRILEDGGVLPAALSGASAGAVNACVLASHWTTDGPDDAAEALERVWQKISKAARFTPFGDFPLLPKLGAEAGSAAFDLLTRMFSPYQFNPLDRNPLRDILAQEIDIEALHHRHCPRLFISATRISDGACRIFTNETISLDAILASTTLPLLHQAVEIDGDFYWDGGYTANPPVRPLADSFRHLPVLLVELMPARQHGDLPKSAREINDRLNQIVFSRPLLDELRAISERPSPPHIERLVISRLPENPSSLDWAQLLSLRDQGRGAAAMWIESQSHMSFRH